MKNPHMHNIICSPGRDCVLIILFQPCGSKAGLFESMLFWVGQYDHPHKLRIGRRNSPILIWFYNLIQFLNNLSKKFQVTKLLILSYRCWYHFFFLASKDKKMQKIGKIS